MQDIECKNCHFCEPSVFGDNRIEPACARTNGVAFSETECLNYEKGERANYILNVDFYAGSDHPEDIDTGTYLLCAEHKYSEEEITELVENANLTCSAGLYEDIDDEELPFVPALYGTDGININTLMRVVDCMVDGKIIDLAGKHFAQPITIANIYAIEQWQ